MASIAYSSSATAVHEDGLISTTPSHQKQSSSYDTPTNNHLTSPANRSRSFSISDILSDEVGSRKRSNNNALFNEPRRKNSKSDHDMVISPDTTPSKVFSSHSVPAMLSPVNMYSSLQQQMKGFGDWSGNDAQRTIRQSPYHARGYVATTPSTTYSNHTSTMVTFPTSYPSIASAYSPQLAVQQYLQFQAVAAQQQQQQQIMAAAAQQENCTASNNSLLYKHKQDDIMENGSNLENSGVMMPYHHQTMPILLKNTRKALKSSTNTDNTVQAIPVSKSTPEGQHYYPYKSHYSRSPLKPPNTTFSPSIFLTRPPSNTPTNAAVATAGYSSPDSEREGPAGGGVMVPNMFMTSTPIRKDEKTAAASFASPHSHSPISATSERKRQQQQTVEHHSWSDNGTDSEVPLLRRPRVPRKRTKPSRPAPSQSHISSPLTTENTNPSSRHTPSSHPPPSTLLTSYTASTGLHTQHNCSNDSGFLSDSNSVVKAPPMPLGMTQEQMAHYGNKTHPLNMSSENVFKTPIKSMYGTGRQPNNGKYPDAWGSSPFTDHLKKTGRIQSVPPWFVCSDKRSDGKRLRLTEAINKSLMETPTSSTSNQLPAEWQKFAYGQTDDQKDLTQKAITFLRCRPRVLKFEKTT